MKKLKEIELSSIEATAYWWVNLIKKKVREIIIQGSSNKKESLFAEIFYYYTEIDWRNLYLELVKYITTDVNNYVLKGNKYGIDAFSQDTDIKGHKNINQALSKITNSSIPDIRLASDNSKDSVIYTNIFGASVWYKSCGVIDLPTKYEPSYVLTGDEQELNFYNLLLSTIATIKEMDRKFNSVNLLRERFCKCYMEVNDIEKINKEEIKEMFNRAFEQASDKGIILGRYYRETYSCHFREIDFIGLEKYMEEAKIYADSVLGNSPVVCIKRTKNKSQS